MWTSLATLLSVCSCVCRTACAVRHNAKLHADNRDESPARVHFSAVFDECAPDIIFGGGCAAKKKGVRRSIPQIFPLFASQKSDMGIIPGGGLFSVMFLFKAVSQAFRST